MLQRLRSLLDFPVRRAAVPASSISRPKAQAGAHQGASTTDRETASWLPSFGSADADLLDDLPMLRARNRDLAINNGIASGAIQTITDNVVGTGFRLSAKPDYRALGRDTDWADDWSNQIEALWRSWSEGTDCDAGRTLNFAGLTQLVFRSGMLNGEALVLPMWLPGQGAFSTSFQVIEADRLATPPHRIDGKGMRAGIEINAYGAPLAYWIKKTHPGDDFAGAATFAWDQGPQDWRRIPTLTPWGRKRVLHIHDKERTGQSRGKPLFSAVMKQFRMLDKYQSSELQAAVINAMIAAFVETPLDQDSMVEMFGGDTDQYLADRNAYIKNRVRLKGGAVMPLYPGDKMSSFSPNRPSDKFAPFVDAMNRHVAASLNMPYELLLKDFSKTNYSSARAALLEAWRFFNGRRKWLSDHWAQPVYELWLEEVVDAGLIDAPGFDEHRRAYARAFWIGPGRGWVDPVKEAKAAQIRMDIGVSTLERECAEQGLDWEEVLEQRARERKRMAELDLLDVANVVSSQPFIPDPPNLEETKP